MEARLRWLGLGIVGLVATLFAAAPVDAQGSLTLRDRLLIASSPSTEAVARMLAGGFADRYEGAQQPHLEVAGTQLGFERFCSGLGPETPDFLLVTRRMPRMIVEHCEANGVADIVEVRLGYGAIVLATRRGDIAPVLSSRHLYEALAAERTDGTAFSGNTATNWADVDASLPRREIRVLVPDTGSGLRALMEDLILEGGCREVRPIRLLFEAAYRRAKCITLRTDGHVTAVPSDGLVAALLSAPPGTIAVMSIDQLLRSGGNLLPLSLDGVLPGAASIMALDYNQSQTKYLYAKRQHSQTRHGVGVVRGIRELLAEATSEQASGPGGYLTGAGLLPLSPADRTAQRRIADRMTLRSR